MQAPPALAGEALWARYEATLAAVNSVQGALAQAEAAGGVPAQELAQLAAREQALRQEAVLLLRLVLAQQPQGD
jgi:hypothetical protein